MNWQNYWKRQAEKRELQERVKANVPETVRLVNLLGTIRQQAEVFKRTNDRHGYSTRSMHFQDVRWMLRKPRLLIAG